MTQAAAREWLTAVLEATRTGERRGSGPASRIGEKGQRTRESLLRSAHRLFSEQGYHATTVAQIAEAAGVSLGTFYQYFADRAAIVAELVGAAVARVLGEQQRLWRVRDGRAGLQRMITGYVSLLAQDVRFWRAWDEVTHTDERLALVRRDLTRVLTDSVERELRRGLRAGLVRAGLDPALTARALTGMVDRFVQTTYLVDPPDSLPTPQDAGRLLTDLWAGAIGLEDPHPGGST